MRTKGRNDFEFKDSIFQKCNNIIGKLGKRISLHIRRNDYLLTQDELSMNYYHEALQHFDKEDKVIRAATKLSNQHGIKIPVNGTILNIEKNGITNQGDIVVAYNVMNRAKDKVSCLKNIQSAVKQGGILSINHVINAKNFVKIEEGL